MVMMKTKVKVKDKMKNLMYEILILSSNQRRIRSQNENKRDIPMGQETPQQYHYSR